MKRITLLLTIALAGLLTISSCGKDDSIGGNRGGGGSRKPDCEVKKYGTVRVVNTSSNPYRVFVNGSFKIQLSGNTFTEIKINEGNGQKLNAEQVSGYILYPTKRETSVNVVRCSEYQWTIP